MQLLMLPSARRARLRAFSLVLAVGIALAATLVGWAFGSPLYMLTGATLGLLLAVSGLIWPQRMSQSYRWWNRAAEQYGRSASWLLVRFCYYLLLTPVACAGSTLMRKRTGQSLWIQRSTLSPLAYSSQCDLNIAGGTGNRMAANCLAWARHSGNLWAAGLLPFLVLIAALDTESKEGYSGHIYTLF